jgi:hypothetical protein
MLFAAGVAALGLLTVAEARSETARSERLVALEFIDQQGRVLDTFPVAMHGEDSHRAYLEAVPQARYSIRVRNLTGHRVGLVIAVDGRNIVSGARSDLGASEAMYVLGPWQTAEYAGWRTSASEVRRFYFTHATDSYASRIGDESAIGVIAVAAFRERAPRQSMRQRSADAVPGAPRAEAESRALGDATAGSPPQAGTGFGEAAQSHAVRVAFTPTRRPGQRSIYKYEWAEQLCARGVKPCEPPNRFWPEPTQFVPFPPGKAG